MQQVGKIARETVIVARALHNARVGHVRLRTVRTGSGQAGVGALALQTRRLRQGQGIERTFVASSFSSDDEKDVGRDSDASGSDSGKYSSSADDVVGFGRVIRDPRKSKADVLRDSLTNNSNVPGNPKAPAPGSRRTLEKTGKPIILSNAEDKTQDEWTQLDEHINEYPGERSFKAIGAGEADFVRSMRACVEKVVGVIEDDQVDTKESSGGKYVSVTFRVMVQSADEMKEIYEEMKKDGRMKFFI